MLRTTILLLCASLFISLSIGCSSSQNNPVMTDNNHVNTSVKESTSSDQMLWGLWEIYFDEAKLKASLIPVRNPNAHFNVTFMILPPNCDDCMTLGINSFDTVSRILDVDVSLRNPHTLKGRDVRGILYTNALGHLLTNPDNWTPLFDIAGGMDINPFRAFAKEVTNRAFNSMAVHAENYLVYIPQPPAYASIKYAVTASWPGNAREPYMIDDFQQVDEISELTGSSGVVQVHVYDWQNDIDYVRLSASEINGQDFIDLTNTSGDTWQVSLINSEGALAGDYEVMIEAHSEGTSDELALYDFATVTITELPPPLGWAINFGSGSSDEGMDIVIDVDGNFYISGRFKDTADFDPSPGVEEHISNGGAECYIAKFDHYGNFQWAQSWGGTGDDTAMAVDVDSTGNVYVCGYFRSTVDFNPGDGVEEYTCLGDFAAFLTKFDTDGNYLWTKVWGDQGADAPHGIVTDVILGNDSSIYVTGYYSGTIDLDPGPETDNHTSHLYAEDLFLIKFDDNGDYQWGNTLGAGSVIPNDIKTDASGNPCITGYFTNTTDFDPDPVDVDEHAGEWYGSSFLVSYDTTGDYLWAKTWGAESGSHDHANGFAIDDTDNFYITGYFESTIDIDPGAGVHEVVSTGNKEIYLLKLSSTGEFAWALTWGSTGEDNGYSVDTYGDGSVYVSGRSVHQVDFDPDPVDEDLKGNDGLGAEAFLSKFDSTGDYQWSLVWGGGVYYSTNLADQVCVWDTTGDVFVTGYFTGSVDFDPGPTEDIHTGADGLIYLVKYTQDGTW